MQLKVYKLGDIAEIVGGVSFSPKDVCSSGIRILRGGNIQSKSIELKDNDVFLPVSYKDANNQVQVGDTILVASTGSVEVLGKAATCFEEIKDTQIGAFLRIIRPKDYKYSMLISIALTSKYFSNYVSAQAKGTSINNIRNDYLKNFEIPIPESALTQISDWYRNIQNKIHINRVINHNLEAMAKQLYDYWFVQFNFPDENGRPYKSSGGRIVWNEKLKREIPEGWEVQKIGSILDKYPSTKKYESKEYLKQGTYPIIDQGDAYIVGFTNDKDNLLTRYPAVLFGDHSTKVKLLDFPFARGADGTQILYSKHPNVSQYYLYFVVLSLPIPNPGYSRHFKYLKDLPIIVPNKELANNFRQIVTHFFTQIKENIFANITLTKLRDELLPLLMNGQVSINYDL